MNHDDPLLPQALLILRLSIGTFFLVWALEKIIAPDVAVRVFNSFYLSDPSHAVVIALGILQAIVVLAFMAGLFKTWTYGALLAMHAVSTLSTWARLINPYEPPNHLFWAAIPVLGALVALFLLRDQDRLATLNVG